MKAFIIFLVLVLFPVICDAKVVVHRFWDKASGEERGISYSDNAGNPAVLNSDWDYEVIPREQKDFYIDKHQGQLKTKKDALEAAKELKKKDIRTKLEALGLGKEEARFLTDSQFN